MAHLNGHSSPHPIADAPAVSAADAVGMEPGADAAATGSLRRTFTALEAAGIEYCLLRDWPSRDVLYRGGEIDMLVDASSVAELDDVLEGLGFARMRSWGHAPHRFYVAYDESLDVWLKLDVVDRLAFGAPGRTLATSFGAGTLNNRRASGPAFVAAPEEACVALLLHCVLDKKRFSSQRCDDLKELCSQVRDPERLTALLGEYWHPSMTYERMAGVIAADRWSELLAYGPEVAGRLRRRDRGGELARRIGGRVLRKLNRVLPHFSNRPITIALLAPDGAGKSTLAEGLRSSFYFPMRSVYMGLYGKGAIRSRTNRVPGVGFALRMLQQWSRYLTAAYHRARGRFVIFDRYTYDALLGGKEGASSLRSLRRWLLAHACPAPDMVFILDAPAEVLYARKGEHDVARLDTQRRGYLEIQSQLPPCAVIDATANPADLRRAVTGMIWNRFTCTTTPGQ